MSMLTCLPDTANSIDYKVYLTKGPFPPTEREVACDPADKGKHYSCLCPELTFAGKRITFTMRDSYDGTWGVLYAESSSGAPIDMYCTGPDGGPRTPNLTMVSQYMGYDGAIVSYTFGKRRTYPDELSAQTSDRKQVSQLKGQRTAHSKNRSDSDEQPSQNLKDNERRLIIQVLKQSNGDTAQAAKKLGISEKALRGKIKDDDIAQ